MNRRARVLVIEDDLIASEIAKEQLVQAGHDVELVGTGEEGIQRAAVIEPDLIMLDIMMPGQDGFSVLETIRASDALREIPVLLITSLNDQPSKLRGFELGADDFITKPFDPIELTAKVTSITRLNRYRKLAEERDRYSVVVNLSRFTVVWLDVDGRILEAPDQFGQLLGMQPPIGSDLIDLLPEDDQGSLDSLIREALDEGRHILEYGAMLEKADGGLVPVLLNLIPSYRGETPVLQVLVKEFPAFAKHIRLTSEKMDADGSNRLTPGDQIIDEICNSLLENIDQAITLDYIVKRSGYSSRTLQYAFKRRFGLSPMKWLQDQRLILAYDRLKAASSETSIYDIMLGCGFSHPSEFGRIFKQKFNLRPSDVLKMGNS